MGEMADYYNDLMFDEDPEWTDNYITCKYCGQVQLHWWDTGHGFRLFDDDDKLHSCKGK